MPQKPHSNFKMKEVFGREMEIVDEILVAKEEHINRIQIPKKDGSPRHVISPSKDLKYIQRSLYWRFFRRYKPNGAAHGFVAKRGISTNADFHVGANAVGKIDIKTFFDSISCDHLKNCLFGNKHVCRFCRFYERMLEGRCHPSLYANKTQSFEHRCEEIKAVYIPEYCVETGYESLFLRIIDTCTYNGFTAQGFPTSPVLANIVMRGFDKTMSAYSEEHNVVYTRYADDLAFSSAELTKGELRDLIQKKAYRLLWAYGFKPNRKKTTWKSRAGRLKICGVVVNDKKSVQRSVVHRFRAKVHHATVKHADRTTKTRIRQLKGWASYLMSIDPVKGHRYMDILLAFERQKFGSAS